MQNPILADLIERIERQGKERDPIHIMPKRRSSRAKSRDPAKLPKRFRNGIPRSEPDWPFSLGMTASFCCDHRLAAIAQIGMCRALADTFAMAPATRAFCVRRFLHNGRRLARIFNNEVAQNKKFFEFFL